MDAFRDEVWIRAELIQWLSVRIERGLSLSAASVCQWVRDGVLLEQLTGFPPPHELNIDWIDDVHQLWLDSSFKEHEGRVHFSNAAEYTDGLSLLIEWLAHDISRMCRGLDPGA